MEMMIPFLLVSTWSTHSLKTALALASILVFSIEHAYHMFS